jgi:hypothetical protein
MEPVFLWLAKREAKIEADPFGMTTRKARVRGSAKAKASARQKQVQGKSRSSAYGAGWQLKNKNKTGDNRKGAVWAGKGWRARSGFLRCTAHKKREQLRSK